MYVFLIIFILLSLAVSVRITNNVDETILNQLHGFGGRWLQGITILGGTYFLIVASLLIILILLLKKQLTQAFLFSCALVMALISYQTVKELVARPRPDIISPSAETLPFLSIYSYPSGHTVGSMTFFLGISLFVLKRDLSLKNVLPFFILPTLVGLGQVSIGEHYISDVIGGIFLSLTVIMLVLELDRVYDFDRYIKQTLDRLKSKFFVRNN